MKFTELMERSYSDIDFSYVLIDLDPEELEITLNGMNDEDWDFVERNRCCNFQRYANKRLVRMDNKKKFTQMMLMLKGYGAKITKGMIKDSGVKLTKKEMMRFI